MSGSNTETETETESGSPDQQPECEFDADDLDISDFRREKYNLEEWECSRPVWEEASGNRCVWHTSNGQIQEKPPAELEKAVGDGDLHGSAAIGVNLTGTNFPVEMSFIHADLPEADLREADLSRADLRESDLSRADLVDVDLPEANLRSANLSGANLIGADLSEADLREADLSEANLIGADLSGATLSEANLIGADLSGAKLRRADLSGADLMRANLSGDPFWADLRGSNRVWYRSRRGSGDPFGADLSYADLSVAKLRRADLSGAKLRRADLSEADLREADLSGADLRYITIGNIRVNNFTKFGSRLPKWLPGPPHARAYHDFRSEVSNRGYDKLARDLYFLEQKARTRTALPSQPITFVGGLLSGLFTGYGVRPRQVFLSTIFVIIVTTLWFNQAGIVYDEWNTTYDLLGREFNTGSVYYSVTTFVTAAPHPPQSTGLLTNLLVTLETYVGTVLTLLLGYALSTRSRI